MVKNLPQKLEIAQIPLLKKFPIFGGSECQRINLYQHLYFVNLQLSLTVVLIQQTKRIIAVPLEKILLPTKIAVQINK